MLAKIEILNILLVGVGGAIGAVMRYFVSLLFIDRGWTLWGMPLSTFIVNIVGSLALGIVYSRVSDTSINLTLSYLFLGVGICGGFTTFSTLSLELFVMIKDMQYVTAFLYVLISVVLGVGAIFAGYQLFR